ncbi:MAG: rRNA pseudouridine synthase [Saprospiraceae bacterium]|nr:rRNA pseudouridine synthase [Saprospiraceae bacterium]
MTKSRKRKDRNPFHQKVKPPSPDLDYPVRLNKYVAKTGICSRRKAVDLIKAGQVSINDRTEIQPYAMVEKDDQVKLDGKVIVPETTHIYLLLNKPTGLISTTADELSRKTILDIIDFEGKERLFPVGRLDRNTSGLILLTNDGDLAKKLSHPSHKVNKRYQVTLDKPLSDHHFDAIGNGLTLEDGLAPVKELEILDPSRMTVSISIVMGRNRIVRRIFESLGYEVKRLDRHYYAGLTKKGLPRGKFRPLTSSEIIMLKHFS